MRHLERILGRLDGVRRNGSGYIARCPAHDDSNPSLAVLPQSDRHVRLLCRSSHCPTAEILQRLGLTFDDLSPDPDDEIIAPDDGLLIIDPRTSPPPNVEVNLDLRHRIYVGLINLLPLSPTHRVDLIRRGLNDDQINRRGYRSLTHEACAAAVPALRSTFTDCELLSVPGFVQGDDGALRLVGPRGGIVIPVLAANGAVQALKVRRDDTSDGRGKYMCLSGGGGPSCGTPVHVPLGVLRPMSEVRLTEGELKADVATAINGPTVGVAGTSTWESALPVLQQLGVQTVRLAFDADFATKPHVARNLLECAESLQNHGYKVSIERWPQEVAKGIDDLLASGRQPELLTDEAASAFLSTIDSASRERSDLIHVGDHNLPANDAATVTNEVLPFPVDVFPEGLRRFAMQAAESVGCPVDLVSIPMLSCAATAVGASRALRIKADWWESPRMYLAVVAPPGSAKSPAESIVTRPLFAMQNRAKQRYDQQCAEYRVAEEQQRRPRRRRGEPEPSIPPASAACRDADGTVESSTQSAAAASTEMDAEQTLHPKPVLQRITTIDATTEALAPLLAKNSRGLLMIRDEMTGWMGSMNQYKGGKGADRQFFLSCWSGQPAIVDRKLQTEPIIVPRPFLNILGGIQPEMLPALADEKGRADGFIDRILYGFPEDVHADGWSDQEIGADVKQGWADALDLLFRLEMRRNEDEGIELPCPMQFTADGRAAWIRWYNAHDEERRSNEFPQALRGPWAKLRAYCARFALVLHLLRMVTGETSAEEVDAESVNRAIRLIVYFKSHARKVYCHLRCDTADRQIEQVVAWIRAHGNECTARQIQRANVGGIKKVSDAIKLIKDLLDRGFGRLEDRDAPNHKKVTHFVLDSTSPDSVG